MSRAESQCRYEHIEYLQDLVIIDRDPFPY